MRDKLNEDALNVMYAMDINSSPARRETIMREMSPTITRNRAQKSGFFLSTWRRMMSTAEMTKLQGFPYLRRGGVTEKQVCAMIGNAMTVPIIARLVRMLLGAIGLIDLDDVPDPCL